MDKSTVLYLSVLVHMFGLFCFYNGFLPSDVPKNHQCNLPNPSLSFLKARYSHMVFVIIDALRADFVLNENHWSKNLNFTRGKIARGETYSFWARAKPPTVTMPRIKALLSGMIPSFKEVLLNTASPEFTDDNLILQFYLHGLNITFFGDDTWLKLFPNSFLRYDGTQSFFVSDYTEVDMNVTRHISNELGKQDWNVMVLHYLGLDHIGHFAGPFSLLVPEKLKEMDHIIKVLYEGLVERDSKLGSKSVLVICGDHGMSETGSHGGASYLEVMTPLLILDSTGKGEKFKDKHVKQVDIAPTLALLFGLQIPKKSVGQPILSLFKNSANSKLVIQHAACQLHCQYLLLSETVLKNDLFLICIGNHSFSESYSELVVEKVSHILHSKSSGYNEWYMLFGVFLLLFSTIFIFVLSLMQSVVSRQSNIKKISCNKTSFVELFQVALLGMAVVSSGSSSYIEEEQYVWYFFTTTLFLLLISFHRQFSKQSILILLLLRLITSWQQTGVKWIKLQDLSDWFVRHENVNKIGLVASLSLIFYFMIQEKNVFGRFIFVIGFLSLISFHFPKALFLTWPDKVLFARLTAMASALSLLLQIWSAKTYIVLLSLLLVREQQIIWICFLVCLERCFTEFITCCNLKDWQVLGLFFSLSKLTFFSQGNSNSFSTIDISSGMIGMYYYHPTISNILTACSTYSGKLFWLASLIDFSKMKRQKLLEHFRSFLLLYHCLEGSFYCLCMYIQRYHLFIWSVYAPRLFYQIASYVLMLLICLFTKVLQF